MLLTKDNIMTKYFGDPANPCAGIEKSKGYYEIIARNAREKVEKEGQVDTEQAEQGLTEIREDTARLIGSACSAICALQNRCMLDNFGAGDPLLKRTERTPLEEQELEAKIYLDYLSLTSERFAGIALM